jgi:hypothetical protein
MVIISTTFHIIPDCPEPEEPLAAWLIALAVIGGIVGIGIILLILWKILTSMAVRKIN